MLTENASHENISCNLRCRSPLPVNGYVTFVAEGLVSEALLPHSMKKAVCKVSVTVVMEMSEIPLCVSSFPGGSSLS